MHKNNVGLKYRKYHAKNSKVNLINNKQNKIIFFEQKADLK